MEKNDIENIVSNEKIQKAYILAYFYNKVCVGVFENDSINFEENVNYNLLTQMRIFNKDKEIKIILNEENKEFDISIINETNSKDKFDEYMIVSENVRLPIELKKDERKNLRILVRNYFEENSNHQVVITKSRLVGFTKTEGGDIIA